MREQAERQRNDAEDLRKEEELKREKLLAEYKELLDKNAQLSNDLINSAK